MTSRMRLSVLALALAFAAAAPQSFAQMSSPRQADRDRNGTGAPSAPPAGMPMGMSGERGMMGGDMDQMMAMMRGMMTMMGGMATMMNAQSGMMSAHLDDRIASLKTELKITDGQAAQWDRFADALRASAKSMHGMFGQMMMQQGATLALPARLERQEKMISAHLDAVKSLEDALGPLYASFSDEQKKVADGLMIGPMGMM